MSQSKNSQQCIGFQLSVPISERAIISDIHLTNAHKQGENVEYFPNKLKALWDTGAERSTISSALADELKLPVISQGYVNGAGGTYLSKEYLAGLQLPNGNIIPSIALYGFAGSPKFDLLIGMDIISLGDFLISTANGTMHFSFQIPSLGGIYLQDIIKAKCSDGQVLTLDQQVINDKKIGRNAQCPCGSGKKYKNCHGAGK